MADVCLFHQDNIFFNGISFVGHFLDNYEQNQYSVDHRMKGISHYTNHFVLQLENSVHFVSFPNWEMKHMIQGDLQGLIHANQHLFLIYKDRLEMLSPSFDSIKRKGSYTSLFWFRLRHNYYYEISPITFSQLYEQWAKELFQWTYNIDDEPQKFFDEVDVLLKTFHNWLEYVFQNFFDNYGYFFFQLIHHDKHKLFILTSSKILFIINYIEKRVEWSHNLNHHDFHWDKMTVYGSHLFQFLVFCQFRLHSVHLHYYILNNIERKVQYLFHHEVLFQRQYCFTTIPSFRFFENNASHFMYLKSAEENIRFHCIFNERFKLSKILEQQKKELHATQKSFSLYRRVFEKGTVSNTPPQSIQKCCVCYDNTANILFLPCNHFRCCYDCGHLLLKCPICRSHILAVRSIFF